MDRIRELELKGNHLFNHPSETDSVLNSDIVVIPLVGMSARVRHGIPNQFRDLNIEITIVDTFQILIV